MELLSSFAFRFKLRRHIQDRINEWFVENRDPATGEYPDFPDADAGGSKAGAYTRPLFSPT